MTILRCTSKLLRCLKQGIKPPEPQAQSNPLGEWYADIETWRRMPVVVMLNAATGAVLFLPGKAADLRVLHERARQQFAEVCAHYNLASAGVDRELNGFQAGFTFAATRDRSLISSLNQRKYTVWMHLEHSDQSLCEVAALDWDGLFQHPSLGRSPHYNSHYHQPLDLVRQCLMPAAEVIPFPSAR